MNRHGLQQPKSTAQRVFVLVVFISAIPSSLFAQKAVVSIARSAKVISPSGPATALTAAGREDVVVSGHSDGKIYWWNPKGKEFAPAWSENGTAVSALALLNSETYLGVIRQEAEMQIFNRKTRKRTATIQTPAHPDIIAVNAIGFTLALKSTHIQISHAHGKLASQALVDPSVSSIGFLQPNNHALALASIAKQSLTAVPSDTASAARPFKFETIDLKRENKRLLDVAFSRFGNAILAVYDDGTLVPLLGERFRPQGEAKFTEFKLSRVLLQNGGWNVIYLGVDPRSNVGRGSIWDLANQRKLADLRDVPKTINSAVLAPGDKLLAISDDSGAIHVWELPKEVIVSGMPNSLLGGKVKAEPWDPPAAPDTPVTHAKWKVARWSNSAAPGYLKDAWKLTPEAGAPSASSLNVHEPGAFFVAIRPDGKLDRTQWEKLVLQRSFMLNSDGWIDFGVCPWKPEATLYCRPQSKGSSNLYGQIFDPLRDDFLFVPGDAYLSAASDAAVPSSARSQLVTLRVRRWLLDREYGKIEKLADAARRSKEQLGWGRPTLGAIYHGFAPSKQLSSANAENRIREYLAQQKDSLTAHIAFAKHSIYTGWNWRGAEIAANLEPEQEQKFTQYLQQAQTVLRRIESSAGDDPYWDETFLNSLPGKGLSTQNIQRLVLSSVKKNPQCADALYPAANYLRPRWTGTPGAAHELAEQLRATVAGDNGVALAAVLASVMHQEEGDRWDAEFGFRVGQYAKDVAVLQKLSPDDDYWKSVGVRIALSRQSSADRKTLWRSLGTRIDVSAFGGFPETAEWNEYIENDPPPAVQWTVERKAAGLVGMSPSGALLFIGSHAGSAQIINVAAGALRSDGWAPFLATQAIAMPSEDRALIAEESGIVHFSTMSGMKRVPFTRPIVIRAAQFSPDGKRLVIVDDAGTILFLNTESGQIVASINNGVDEKRRQFPAVAVSGDNVLAAVSTGGNVVTLFKTETGEEAMKLPAPAGDPYVLCFHHDSQQLGAANAAKIWNWDLTRKEETWSMKASRFGILRLEISANGRYWAMLTHSASGHDEMSLHVLDREQLPERWRMLPAVRSDADFAWHPTLPQLAVYSNSGIVSYWEVDKLP
ncbi:WD40 repeat domain-containing protein [Planctellipticum variicoloris]|uniref:WD40 repeat domain-containing protein n=1 Tax=Planctellipticum variicoloris TaxID=3064265 RepID=UPI003013F05F|nr:WD40 repeat domain-containing protein [Planctomycetaceae bacterium SH412]